MKPALSAALRQRLLLGIAALTLFPLLWMVAVSLMAPGDRQHVSRRRSCPPHPTLANYRELFAREGIGRYVANSVLLATA